jgi:hypothetical protein
MEARVFWRILVHFAPIWRVKVLLLARFAAGSHQLGLWTGASLTNND